MPDLNDEESDPDQEVMSLSGGSDLNDGDAYETFYNLRQMQTRKENRRQPRLERKDNSQVEAAGRSANEALPAKKGRERGWAVKTSEIRRQSRTWRRESVHERISRLLDAFGFHLPPAISL